MTPVDLPVSRSQSRVALTPTSLFVDVVQNSEASESPLKIAATTSDLKLFAAPAGPKTFLKPLKIKRKVSVALADLDAADKLMRSSSIAAARLFLFCNGSRGTGAEKFKQRHGLILGKICNENHGEMTSSNEDQVQYKYLIQKIRSSTPRPETSQAINICDVSGGRSCGAVGGYHDRLQFKTRTAPPPVLHTFPPPSMSVPLTLNPRQAKAQTQGERYLSPRSPRLNLDTTGLLSRHLSGSSQGISEAQGTSPASRIQIPYSVFSSFPVNQLAPQSLGNPVAGGKQNMTWRKVWDTANAAEVEILQLQGEVSLTKCIRKLSQSPQCQEAQVRISVVGENGVEVATLHPPGREWNTRMTCQGVKHAKLTRGIQKNRQKNRGLQKQEW
jgi:hypothetical protein